MALPSRTTRGAYGSLAAALMIGLAAVSGEGCVTTPGHGRASMVPVEVDDGQADASPELAARAATDEPEGPDAEAEPEREPPWSPPPEPILDGVAGAGQLLARGEPDAALEHLAALGKLDTAPGESALVPESREWFIAGAVAGRAYMQTGQWQQAVLVLEPLAASKQFADNLPRDIVGYALARARMAWAAQLDPTTADLQLARAASELGALVKLKPARIQAAIRVAQGEALAAIRGADPKAAKRAAVKADKALERLVTSFPNHPQVGEWMLERALAQARIAGPREAAVALREVSIARAGEPEAARAWLELERLAGESDKIEAPPLTTVERLAAGQAARVLRRIDRSRELLESVWSDASQPRHRHREAGFSLGWTYYKARDYDACVDVFGALYADVKSIETRKDLSRCLERGGRYDEAVDLWVAVFDGNKGAYGSSSLWRAIELAVDGGLYQRGLDLLDKYEERYKGNGSARRWLHAWLPMRLGDADTARARFAEMLATGRTGGREREITYFLGKLELAHADAEVHLRGLARLRELSDFTAERLTANGVIGGHPIYYGLLARQRMLDAGFDPGPAPALAPIDWEQRWLGYAETTALLGRMAVEHGALFSSLVRAEQLLAAGWRDEASREARVAADEYINGRAAYGGTGMPGTRSEALIAGLAWASEWKHPTASPGKAARKALRDEELREALREDFLALSFAMQEPYRFAKLLPYVDAPYRARWHLRAYREPIERHAWTNEVDPHHMWALMYTESRFRRHVVSHVGARGALQVMPWTGRQLAQDLGELQRGERFDPDILFQIEDNSRLAVFYIAELLHKFNDQPAFAYASYNGGPNNVARWLKAKSASPRGIELDEFVEEIPFAETSRYVRRVMEVEATYELLYRGALPTWTFTVDPQYGDNIDY